MKTPIQTIISLCFFKAKPQDISADKGTFFQIALITLTLVTIISWMQTQSSYAFLMSMVQLLLYGAGIHIITHLFGFRARWQQSTCAIFGSVAGINLLLIMLIQITGTPVLLISLDEPPMLLLVANMWSFSLIVFILKETLEIKLLLAIVISLAMELAITIIFLKLFQNQF